MKSYKNKRVRSRRNKSRRYSRKRKGGEIVIDATKDYKMFKFPGCKDLINKVIKIKQENPNQEFTFSDKAEEQIDKCNNRNNKGEGAITYRSQIENIIKNNQSYNIETATPTEENALQHQVISPEELAEAEKEIAQEAAKRRNEMAQEAALKRLNAARISMGKQPLDELPKLPDPTPSSQIPAGPRSSILNAEPRPVPGPYDGGKKRRHRRKSRKHSRRH